MTATENAPEAIQATTVGEGNEWGRRRGKFEAPQR